MIVKHFLILLCLFLLEDNLCAVPVGGFDEGNTKLDSARIDKLNDHAWSLARSKPDSAEYYAQEAERLSKLSGGYKRGLLNANVVLGSLDKDRGYYGLSVEHYLTALRLAEATGDSLRVSGCLNNLGSVYQEQGNHLKALQYFQRSLGIERKMGKDKAQESIRLYNLGEAYFALDSLDKAEAYYYNSFLIEDTLKSMEGMFYARLGIGKVDAKKGNLTTAMEELARAKALAHELQNSPGLCETHLALGELYMKMARTDLASLEIDSALSLSLLYDYQGLQMQALGIQYRIWKEKGDLLRANEALVDYYELRLKLNSAAVNSRVEEMQLRYALEKKDKEIAIYAKNEEIRENQVKYEQKLRNYLIFTILFAIALIVFNLRKGSRAA